MESEKEISERSRKSQWEDQQDDKTKREFIEPSAGAVYHVGFKIRMIKFTKS